VPDSNDITYGNYVKLAK